MVPLRDFFAEMRQIPKLETSIKTHIPAIIIRFFIESATEIHYTLNLLSCNYI